MLMVGLVSKFVGLILGIQSASLLQEVTTGSVEDHNRGVVNSDHVLSFNQQNCHEDLRGTHVQVEHWSLQQVAALHHELGFLLEVSRDQEFVTEHGHH